LSEKERHRERKNLLKQSPKVLPWRFSLNQLHPEKFAGFTKTKSSCSSSSTSSSCSSSTRSSIHLSQERKLASLHVTPISSHLLKQ